MRPSSATLRYVVASLCVCTFVNTGVSRADSLSGIGGSIGWTSDYIFRGISQSLGNPAVQADLHYQFAPGWVAGVWGSRADVDADETTAFELDVYLSRQWLLDEDWDLRVTLSHYTYPDDPRTYSYDYDEVIVALGYESRLFATVAWSPNTTMYGNGALAINQSALTYELAATQPLVGPIAASAGVGYYDLPSLLDADYWFWNVGLACSLGRTQVAVAYIGSDGNAERAFGYDRAGHQWSGSVAWRF